MTKLKVLHFFCLFLLVHVSTADETDRKNSREFIRRLIAHIPNSNLSITTFAQRVGESLKEVANRIPQSNLSLGKIADRFDGSVKKVVNRLPPPSETFHVIGERVMNGLKSLTTLLPNSSKSDESKDKKKPFGLNINIPHIFSMKLSSKPSEGKSLGISVLRPLLDLNIRRRKKEKDEIDERKGKEDKEENTDGENKKKDEIK